MRETEYKEPTMDLAKIEDKLLWDFKLAEEFTNRKKGFAFVIDVYSKNPQLTLYKVGDMLSSTKFLPKQPPVEMMVRAVQEQGGSLDDNNLFDATDEVKSWIKENLM
ncbi:MAG: hypothetical protein FH756_17045 [Firmicutes bacterium]|nr:hypothetical protein [Bacillota bacterium]